MYVGLAAKYAHLDTALTAVDVDSRSKNNTVVKSVKLRVIICSCVTYCCASSQ